MQALNRHRNLDNRIGILCASKLPLQNIWRYARKVLTSDIRTVPGFAIRDRAGRTRTEAPSGPHYDSTHRVSLLDFTIHILGIRLELRVQVLHHRYLC